ncbi:hypothetical protein BKP45_11080 [Anaerobacillus alkalidiazotrophicus]|uniref:Uncharacterized protein n=2 Tax=Anaerobacillus alkalidiazotrophicus TaxID=472963 RepID=A0A1S2M4G4_9BACI|nr:hypothetical protein BKP45_16795 [Anaerobacillus alkalidiazotrophicus]OIJ19611.1 hypothetical protein BKP45_11080 [Anaerobacillus alkalidiazotrophicus]
MWYAIFWQHSKLTKAIIEQEIIGMFKLNIAIYMTLLFSLIVSTITSIWIYKKKTNKWLGMLIGLCINTLLLLGATIIFHKIFNVKEVDGLFASLGILIFAFFVPIFTCINFSILEFMRYKIYGIK